MMMKMTSCSHDDTVRLWDMSFLHEGSDDDEDEDGEVREESGVQVQTQEAQSTAESARPHKKRRTEKLRKGKGGKRQADTFFDGL